MRNYQKTSYILIATVGLLLASSPVHAATQTTLTLTHTIGDVMQLSVSAEVSKEIQLSFLPPGAATVTTIVLGTTDTSGKFSTSLSSGGYAIPQGSPVFATVGGVQSSMMLWPSYTSSLVLSKTSVQVAVGQSVSVGGSAALILAANSQGSSIATSVSASQVTITGTRSGSGTVTLCAANAGCGSIAVEVGAQTGQTQITFSPENVVLSVDQSSSVAVLGGGTNGYMLSSNSNPAVLEPSFTGTRRTLYLFAKAAGTSTVTVCSLETSTNCSNLVVTILTATTQTLSFTPGSLTLIPGLTQSATVSGGPDNQYFISSNSNSGAAQASISGTIVTAVGGSKAGSTTVTVCSATTSNRCGTLTITLNDTTASSSSSTLSFSQNVVTVAQGETTNVTVTGGNSTSFSISSNTAPSIVTATINGNSNVVSLYGNAAGSAIVTVCSTVAGTTCASAYVTVGPVLPAIILSQNTITLAPGGKTLISITGGDAKTKIYSNSTPGIVSAVLSGNGAAIILIGGTTSGSSVVTICPSDVYSSKCATLSVTTATTAPPVATSPAGLPLVVSPSTATTLLLRVQGDPKVYVVKDGKKQWIKTEAEFSAGGYKWSDVAMTTPAILALYPDLTVTTAAKARVKITNTPAMNVRQSNTTQSKIVGTVKTGAVYTTLEQKNGWYKIKVSATVTGWVSGTYAKKQ